MNEINNIEPKEKEYKLISLRIKKLIRDKGTTIQELADKLNITRVGLSKNIYGNPSYDTISNIAAALDVPLWQLFVDPEDMEKGYGAGGGAVACGAKCPHCGGALNIRVE